MSVFSSSLDALVNVSAVSYTHLDVYKRQVHTCAPEKGENAIFQMPDLLEGVTPNGFSQVLEMVTEFFSDCTAPKLGLRTKEEYFAGEFIHRTVFTPVLIRTSGSFVEVGINVRFAYTTTEDELLRAFRRLCEEYEGCLLYTSRCV